MNRKFKLSGSFTIYLVSPGFVYRQDGFRTVSGKYMN